MPNYVPLRPLFGRDGVGLMLAALLCVPLASGAQCVPAVAASGDSRGPNIFFFHHAQ